MVSPSAVRLNGDDANSTQTFDSSLSAWTTAFQSSVQPLYLYNPTGTATNVALGNFANGAKSSGQDVWTNLNFNRQGGSIAFDLLRLDTWDNESFNVYANDVSILSTIFGGLSNESSPRSGSSNGYSWLITPYPDYLVGSNGFTKQTFNVNIRVSTAVTSLKLGFGSSLNEAPDNESYAIDNFIARTNLGQVLLDETFDGTLGGWQRPSGVRASALVRGLSGNTALGNFSNASLNGQDIWKQFSLSGDGTIIKFTVIRQGNWQAGSDKFKVYANDNAIITTDLTSGSGSNSSYDWLITQGAAGADGQAFNVSIRVKTNDTALKLGFGSTLTDTTNKSYAIDNVRVIDTLHVTALPSASVNGQAISVDINALGNVMLPADYDTNKDYLQITSSGVISRANGMLGGAAIETTLRDTSNKVPITEQVFNAMLAFTSRVRRTVARVQRKEIKGAEDILPSDV
jgi:hypothetical protein